MSVIIVDQDRSMKQILTFFFVAVVAVALFLLFDEAPALSNGDPSSQPEVAGLLVPEPTDTGCTSALPLKTIIAEQNINRNHISLTIDKSEYRLYVMAKEQCLKAYPVVFGSNPVDDKLMQGDGCTPEGTFKIRSKYPHRSWNKFVWIDYPTSDSWKKHKAAKASGKIPKSAKIGGEIGIHGVPEGADWAIEARENWTLGCISLTNTAIDEIYPYIGDGTTINIRP